MIWTCSKQFAPDQNNLYLSKPIWTVQNHFGSIKGQGIISKLFKIEGGGPIELKWRNHSEHSELVITSEWEVDVKHKDKCSNSKFLEGNFINH